MALEDTIVALATPPGEGGISVIRLSGSESINIAGKLFVSKSGKRLDEFKDRYFYYGYIKDDGDNIVDEVLMVTMRAPRTYTREDVAEIHCHGGMIPVRRITELAIIKGARLAEPGEFTKRAFLNGRIDLAQAEGVMELIGAKSEEAAKASLSQMEGVLSRQIHDLRDELIDLLARIEVTVDYPEEDIDAVLTEQIRDRLLYMRGRCKELLSTADQGRLIREGIKTVIIGKPNVGKSSLLNALVRENRAIVTDIPGTTRDVIEEYINIKGILVRVLDTAGIRETMDLVEKIGVEKSRDMIKDADLVLLMLDASSPLEQEDHDIIAWLEGKKVLVILNKTDKPAVTDEQQIRSLTSNTVIKASMTEGTGVEEIRSYIYNMVYAGKLTAGNTTMVINNRHKEALIRADRFISDSIESTFASVPLDMVTIDIRNAVDALGEITGESVTDDLIDKIFMEFCLGK